LWWLVLRESDSGHFDNGTAARGLSKTGELNDLERAPGHRVFRKLMASIRVMNLTARIQADTAHDLVLENLDKGPVTSTFAWS